MGAIESDALFILREDPHMRASREEEDGAHRRIRFTNTVRCLTQRGGGWDDNTGTRDNDED
jgi:hypothetical protein